MRVRVRKQLFGAAIAALLIATVPPAGYTPARAEDSDVGAVDAFGVTLLWHITLLAGEAFADGRIAQATIAVPEMWVWLPAPVGSALFVAAAAVQLGRAVWPAPVDK